MTDHEGFREFVEMRYAGLLRTAFLLTGSTHAAEDLVQTALLKAYRQWEHLDDPYPDLRRTMINTHISLWRRIGSRELINGRAREIGEQSGREEPYSDDAQSSPAAT